jgi:hypothetical protein
MLPLHAWSMKLPMYSRLFSGSNFTCTFAAVFHVTSTTLQLEFLEGSSWVTLPGDRVTFAGGAASTTTTVTRTCDTCHCPEVRGDSELRESLERELLTAERELLVVSVAGEVV